MGSQRLLGCCIVVFMAGNIYRVIVFAIINIIFQAIYLQDWLILFPVASISRVLFLGSQNSHIDCACSCQGMPVRLYWAAFFPP